MNGRPLFESAQRISDRRVLGHVVKEGPAGADSCFGFADGRGKVADQ
jgi:hypothetical protein